MPLPDRSLVIRADDAGSAPGANRAILQALRAGAVTAVGFMAVAPAFTDAVALLRAELGTVDVGVHATINAEWDTLRWGPLCPADTVPSLLNDAGHFLSHPRESQARFKLAEVISEIHQQISAIRAHGLNPSYLDTHMGFDRLPGIGDALCQLATETDLLFTAREPHPICVTDVRGSGTIGTAWINCIRALPSGRYQLITHPGSDTPDLHAFVHRGLEAGQIARERAEETSTLCSAAFRESLRDASVRLVRFSTPA